MRVPDPRVFQASKLRKLPFACGLLLATAFVTERAQPGHLRRINAAVARPPGAPSSFQAKGAIIDVCGPGAVSNISSASRSTLSCMSRRPGWPHSPKRVRGRRVRLSCCGPARRSAERAAALLQSPALRRCSGARPEKAAFSGRLVSGIWAAKTDASAPLMREDNDAQNDHDRDDHDEPVHHAQASHRGTVARRCGRRPNSFG